ncbi:MAG: tRNA-modifying protein YgfZ [Actinomycetota bacterium]|nr:tRNA-modifying protein YgfZ [Actinomycetota bacterium]MDQ1640979.1 tRNA-modifying protein YgfZ [Actinomycetota bacterium]
MTSPLLALPGAVPADAPDQDVAAHYGDPFREQRRLESGVGAVDLSHRPVLRITGPDRLTWLHSLTSQHLEALPPGVASEALILSPTGHVEHALYLVDDGATTWVHIEPGTAGTLVGWLDSMRFWSKVEIEDASTSYAVVWQPVTEPSDAHVSRVVTASDGVLAGRDLFVPREQLVAFVREPAGIWAYEALRIAAGQPRLGFETDHRTIPHEVNWIGRAVHMDKGCYRGQETVARVHNLGRPPRRLVMLHLDGSDSQLPAHGDAVELDGRAVGFVTSAARHHELGPVALALVKRSTPEDAELTAGGIAASQQSLTRAEL